MVCKSFSDLENQRERKREKGFNFMSLLNCIRKFATADHSLRDTSKCGCLKFENEKRLKKDNSHQREINQ